MTKVSALVLLTREGLRKNRRKGETFPFLNNSGSYTPLTTI